MDDTESGMVAHLREQARASRDPNVRRQISALARQCEKLGLAIEEGPTCKRGRGLPVRQQLTAASAAVRPCPSPRCR
jgi:hypothetical protein